MSAVGTTWGSIKSAPEYVEAISIIASEAERLATELPPELSTTIKERYLDHIARCRDVDSEDRVRKALAPLERDIASTFSTNHLDRVRRLIIATLALNLEGKHADRSISQSILRLFPERMARLASHLTSSGEPTHDDLDYMRDLRFVAGFTVPALSNDMDLVSRVTPGSLLKCLARPDSRRGALRLLLSRSFQPWFRLHVDGRYLAHYNERGKTQSFLKIADMLRCNPAVLGCVGTGWPVDPKLDDVSPRLTFLRSIPLGGGAFLLRHGTSELTVKRALSKSQTRRRLYESGKYVPTNYSLVWLRPDLIAWAASIRASGASADE